MAGTFPGAIEKIPTLSRALKPGLQALRNRDRNSVLVGNSRILSGSVDIDQALKETRPRESRWDYCIGVKHGRGSDSVVWIEVHPANSLSVSDMIAKARWLITWLGVEGKPLMELVDGRPDLRWVPTGRVAIRRGGKEHHQLAKAGIGFPQRQIVL